MALLISGHQRSGTTLLRRICDGHPQMRVSNEFGCFLDVGQSYARSLIFRFAQWRLVNGRWAFDSAFANSKRRQLHNLQFTLAYLRWLAAFQQGAITVTAVAHALQAQFPHARVAGDKLPQYMPLLPQIAGDEQVKIVVIYRDCRDVTSSFLEKVRTVWRSRPWVTEVDTAAKIARNWVQKIDLMESLVPYIHTLRYEDLVSQPQQTLLNLSGWLEIDPAGFNPAAVKTTSIGKHQQGLTQTELDDIWQIAGPTMQRLGYQAQA